MSAPRVFVSHASEDKERFVLEFATQLRANGIDAWLDRWEMAPGDSLVDKLFEEGIGNATAIIIVLSKKSVKKAWVREELNAAMVRRIEKGSRLIPILIDRCEVPECLKSTIWVEVDDLADYSVELATIVAAIFGHTERPPLGPPPAYVGGKGLGGLKDLDSAVLRAFCTLALSKGETIVLSTEDAWSEVDAIGVSRGAFHDSLEILAQGGYLEPSKSFGRPPPYFGVTLRGLELFLRSERGDYPEVRVDIAGLLVNENSYDNKVLAENLSEPVVLVNHVLNDFERKGYLKQTKTIGGGQRVNRVRAKLRRDLGEGRDA